MDCTVEIDRLLVIDGSVDGRIDSGSTDPGAAVTRPDSDMTAGLHTVLAGCTLAFFELVNRLMTLGTPG